MIGINSYTWCVSWNDFGGLGISLGELPGRGRLQTNPQSLTIEVFQSRRVHSLIADRFQTYRVFKTTQRALRDYDVSSLYRATLDPGESPDIYDLSEELLWRSIIIIESTGELLVADGESFREIDDLVAFLDQQSPAV